MKKIILLILLISFLGTIFLIYKDFSTNNLNKGYYLVQSYFFIFIVISSIIVLYLNKEVQRYFLILLTSIFISLYIFEFYVFKSGGIKFFTSAKDHWQNDIIFHKKRIKEENALSSFSLTNEEIVSFSGISNSKIVFCKESDAFSMYTSDRYGFNNPDSVWDNQADLIVLGDSFVHGACVNDNETISRKLESFSNINTLNLGSGSNGPYEYMAIMKSLIKPILKKSNKENTVILVFYDNDNKTTNKKKESLVNITNSIVEFSPKLGFYPKDSYLKKYYNFIRSNYDLSKSEIISEIKKVAKKNFKNSAFYNISTIFPLRKRMKLINSFFIRENYNETFHSPSQRAILMLSNICKNKCKPYIAYIPERNIGNFNSRKVLKYKKTLVETSNKLKIPFLDAQKFLDKRNRDNYAPKGSHLSIKGYEDFANFLNKNIN